MIGRRTFIHAAGGITATALAPRVVAWTPETRGAYTSQRALRLVPIPSRVFRTTADYNRDRIESWRCYLRVLGPTADPVSITRVVISQCTGNTVKVVETHEGSAAAALDMLSGQPPQRSTAPYVLAQLRLAAAPLQSVTIDTVRVEVTIHGRSGAAERVEGEFTLESYAQRTKLVFPFRGVGIIQQGGAANSGHRNRSGMFAIDALGLTDLYAVMIKRGDTPDCLAGWGRPIIVPAAGVVVVARGDRPDQPSIGNADPRYFVPEFPDGGDPGNHVVIDHGDGEFSMIAHLQQGTLAVAVGQRVGQGQRLGLLGNSGDSTAPHVHHQLQTGPDWTTVDALPHAYEMAVHHLPATALRTQTGVELQRPDRLAVRPHPSLRRLYVGPATWRVAGASG